MFNANFTISPSSGDVRATEFTFQDQTSGGSVFRYVWDLGNGDLIYNISSPTYTFKHPGNYNITLSATDFDGNTSSITKQIYVDLVYRDYLKFTQIPETYADPGKKTDVPFKIEVISSNPDKPLLVDLFATNSKSIPHKYVPEKWNFLTPTWKFLDKDSNIVTTLSVDPVKIYKNNEVVAVSGIGEFYYVDSMSTGNPANNCPLLITATLQTSGFTNIADSSVYNYDSYANNESVRAALVWQVNDLFPSRLKITGNYLDPINKLQWKNIKIPILITVHSNRSDLIPGSKDELSEVVFSYPKDNTFKKLSEVFATKEIKIIVIKDYLSLDQFTGYLLQENSDKILLELSDIYISSIISTLDDGKYVLNDSPLYFKSTDSEGFNTGGYLFTTATVLSSIENASITIQTLGIGSDQITNNFIYPDGFSPNTSVWISNPGQGALNKITLVPNNGNCETINYFKNKKLLVDGIIKEVKVPIVETTNTINNSLSGFSGIYSIAIDPRNYDVVAADTELDRIYKISNKGEITKTFSLSSLNDYDSRKKMLDSWSWKTPSQSLSSTNYIFYSPAFRSLNYKNYIATLDGLILPTNHIQIPDYQTVRISAPSGINVPLNREAYPPENLEFNVIQIFNPLLPNSYIDSIDSWTYETSTSTNSFPLTGSLTILNNSKRFIVSVDGFYTTPSEYSINTSTQQLIFTNPVSPQKVVNIHYFKNSLTPAYWENNLLSDTNTIPLTGNNDYIADDKSGFIVAVDRKIINPNTYFFDLTSKQLFFNQNLLAGSTVSITQISVDENLDIPAAYTPSSVSIDKNYNVWVTLFNTVSVLKFDPDLNLLFSTAPENIHWETRPWSTMPSGIDYQASIFGSTTRQVNPVLSQEDLYTDDFFLKPSVAETDKENNCWVTYSNSLCSLLVKYDPNGKQLTQIPTGLYSTPTNLAITSFNNVWVANSHDSSFEYTPLSGSLDLFDGETYQKIKSVKGISKPQYLSIDRSNNLWFSHGLRRIGYYNSYTNVLSSWVLDLSGNFTLFEMPSGNLKNFDEIDNEENNEIGGLAVDVYDRVWILDNLTNNVWVISATPFFNDVEIRKFKAKPENLIGYYIDPKDGSQYTESKNYYYSSIVANGDWTGNKWYQKYITSESLSSVLLSGVSDIFSVKDFEDVNRIRRVNESFNNAKYFKDLALPEILKNNTKLFDDFFAGTVGTSYLSANEDIGQTIYEKIANFVSNHGDVDTCNVDQLLSFAEQVDEPVLDYAANYPFELKRLIDIFSVPRSKLWGLKEQKPLFPQSIGSQYSDSDFIQAGEKIIAKNRFDNSIKIISVPVQNGETTYRLSEFLGYGLHQPILSNYLFYRYTPVYSGNYIENIIDWNSEFTTLSPYLSSYDELYGEGGSVENAFRYLLTKKLIS
jgi:PKD repeat protein